MDQSVRTRFVQPPRGRAEFFLSLVHRAGCRRFPDFPQLGPQDRPGRTIPTPTLLALLQPFFALFVLGMLTVYL